MVMAVHGATQADVRKKTLLSSSTVSETVARLVNYNIIYEEIDLLRPNPREPRYRLNDFYLNFYFFFLERLTHVIKRNNDGKTLLLTQKILKHDGFYVEGFSGYAFEGLFRYCLTQYPLNRRLQDLLMLGDQNFEIGSYNDGKSQIDLLISGAEDRIVRVIECKWGSHKTEWLSKLANKPFELPEHCMRINFIVIDSKPSKSFADAAKKVGVQVITLDDLFSV